MRLNIDNDIVGIIGENERAKSIYKYLKKRLNVIQMTSNDFDDIKDKKDISFRIGILAGYGRILEGDRISFFNDHLLTCHGGMLPEYRGSSPMNWALVNGEQYFGLSVIKTRKIIDEGEIYEFARFDILENHSIQDLHKIAHKHFPPLVFSSLLKIAYDVKPIKQIQFGKNYFPARDLNDAQCNFKKQAAREVVNLFRAVRGAYHPPWFEIQGEVVKIKNARVVSNFLGTPGKVYQIRNNEILIMCKAEAVFITVDKPKLFKRYMEI
tara:strand:- start:10452 stop:11252 length:801 start_codon:yes stop_codon:yes gene_type:complete